MPRYLTQHSLACLTRQGAEALARRMQTGPEVRAQRVFVNTTEGKMVAEFEAESKEALEAWLQKEKIHLDWISRVELEMLDGKLQPAQ
jgi:hypothetical protein